MYYLWETRELFRSVCLFFSCSFFVEKLIGVTIYLITTNCICRFIFTYEISHF